MIQFTEDEYHLIYRALISHATTAAPETAAAASSLANRMLDNVGTQPAPTPRTEDYTAEELFPNAESDDYFQCCQECGSNVLSNARWQAKHVSWHNKLLP